jgi:hypothetical protein
MTCPDFEKVVVAIARGEMADAAGAEHAETCARCARRLANERRLSGLIAAAVADDGGRVAPPAVEQAVIAAFRKQRAVARPGRRVWWARAAVAAIAAAVVLAAVVVSLRKPGEQTSKAQPRPPHESVARASVSAAVPVVREVRKPKSRTARGSRRNPVGPSKPQVMPANREHMTDFIPVFYDPEPIERGQIVRVRLPRTALTVFGLPVNEEQAEGTIRADVLLGEDGLARAVRFVK